MNRVLLLSFVVGAITWICYLLRRKKAKKDIKREDFGLQTLTNQIREIIYDTVYENSFTDFAGKNPKQGTRLYQRKLLSEALRNCCNGDRADKLFIKDYIKEILQKELSVSPETIGRILPFDQPERLAADIKFKILLHIYEMKYGQNAFAELFDDCFSEKLVHPSEGICEEDVDRAYEFCMQEDRSRYPKELLYEDKLCILSDLIYETFGHGTIDTIRDQNIDGISAGVAGISAYDHIWIMFRGTTMRLRFLSFHSEEELERVEKSLIRYHATGELSASNPKMVVDMKDGSRVTAVRPPFAESYAFFVRKFSKEKVSLDTLLLDENNEQMKTLLISLVAGGANIAVTGGQGAGKTTLLKALVRYLSPQMNVRVEEMVFELWMREIYPNRNILSFRETEYVSAEEGINLMKKTDAQVMLFGEVACIETAALLVELSQVSEQQMFTHHAVDTDKLIAYFRNALLRTGIFREEKLAWQQAAEAIHIDIHVEKNIYGHRYIERVTEVIREHTDTGYRTEILAVMENGAYKILHEPSEILKQRLKKRLDKTMHEAFVKLYG